MKRYITLSMSFVLAARIAFADTGGNVSTDGEDVLAPFGVKGGLVVVIGCPSLNSEQRILEQLTRTAGGPCVIQFLDTADARIDEARKAIRLKELRGKVSAVAFDGQNLPYIDNLVNLVVVNDKSLVEHEEIMRVLAPLGVACIDGKTLSETLLNGVWALTGQRDLKLESGKLENPLVKGAAYDDLVLKPQPANAWSTYRRDNTRSGFAQTSVPSKLKVLWEAKLPGAATQPVI